MEKLVIESQNGSKQAMSDLIENTQTKLLRFCVYLTGDLSIAEDLCQDCFVRVLSKIKSLKEPKKFISWLFKMAKNAYLDYLKSASVSRTDHLSAIKDELSSSASRDFELISKISRSLAVLDPKDRFILLMVDQQGLSYAEVADIIGFSESAVTSRIHRIRKVFAEKFDKS